MKCGLLGRKLEHSYSPQIHAYLGSYSYELFEQEPEQLKQFLKDGDFAGINVTIPAEALVGGHRLYVGVYGHMDNGAYATPTVMVKGPRVLHGADPTLSPDGGKVTVLEEVDEQQP